VTSLHLTYLAAEQKSAEVTNWSGRIGWLVGLALFIALVYWLMREGWAICPSCPPRRPSPLRRN
jgi:uncharacterized membrane protein